MLHIRRHSIKRQYLLIWAASGWLRGKATDTNLSAYASNDEVLFTLNSAYQWPKDEFVTLPSKSEYFRLRQGQSQADQQQRDTSYQLTTGRHTTYVIGGGQIRLGSDYGMSDQHFMYK
jgi:hypothetical protein